MRIVSLNVNGLRSFDEKNNRSFNDFCLNVLRADIVCLQEVKGSEGSLAKYHALADYQAFTSILVKGRHGVSTLVRKTLYCCKAQEVLKGRILKTFHGNFVLYNCYMPYFDETKGGDKSETIGCYNLLRREIGDARIVLCGDFNAAYSILDHYQYKNELDSIVRVERWEEEVARVRCTVEDSRVMTEKIKQKKAMLKRLIETSEELMDPSIVQDQVEKIRPSKTELPYHFFSTDALERHFFDVYQRKWMKSFTESFLDTFRTFNKELEQYTCWNTIFNLRPANLGTRIDYVLCTKDVECIGAGIMQDVKGSDHCPVYAVFRIEELEDGPGNLLKRRNNLLDFFNATR